MCFMPLLALLITISNSYAYYLDNNGDIMSNNLFDYSKASVEGNDLIYSNGVLTGSDSKSYFAFMLQTIDISNNITTIDNVDVFSSGVHYHSFTKTSNIKAIQFGHNGSSNDIKLRYDISNLTNGTYTLSINILSSNNPKSFGDIMLNVGSDYMVYEPFEVWYNSNKYQKQSLYSLLNGTTCSLWSFYQDNIETGVLIALDTLNLSVDQKSLTLNDMPNIKSEIQNQTSADWFNTGRYYILVGLGKQQINAVVRYGDFSSTYQYLALTGSDRGLFDKNIYGTNESQSINVNTMGNEYVGLRIFNMQGLNENFNLQLSFSSSDYNLGYNDGYSSGYNSAMSSGNSNAYIDGYNKGYNEGVEEDLSSSGFKTLITTILSYPVNMVRESLNFEFMGVHVASIVLFVVSLGIVAFVIKRFKD